MTSKNKLKYAIIVIILILAGFAMADALGFFNPKPYTKVSKGSHAHYVPDDRNPDVPITRFPKQPPRKSEKITPQRANYPEIASVINQNDNSKFYKVMRLFIYILPIFLFLACGGGEQQEQRTQSEEPEVQSPQTEFGDVRTIDIIGVDRMKYVVKEEGELIGTGETIKTSTGDTYLLLQNIEAKAGEKLRIRLTTVSKLPASAMSHNWILFKMGVDPAGFAQASTQAKDNDYIPQDRTDDIIAHTELAAGGETVKVTFTVPEKTGNYDYLCSFPAHFMAGMKGKLMVQ